MRIGVPKEIKVHEYRVGLVPASVRELTAAGHSVTVETGAGAGIGFSDKDYQAADKALNQAYDAALASTKSRDDEKPYDAKSFEEVMRAAQRAWVAYRDADCKDLIAQEWFGGTGTTAASLGCMTEKTIQRTKELKERYGEH